MQNSKCKIQNAKFKMQNSVIPISPKIVNYEIIFVRSKVAKAEHTKRYVSISISAALVQKELIRTILD